MELPEQGAGRPASLAAAARTIVATADLDAKIALSRRTADLWFARQLSLRRPTLDPPAPKRPGRPDRPQLLAPRDMPRRSADSRTGHIALLHAIAHIELNAVDLAWDIVGRFAGERVPRSFFDDWVTVGLEESIHFGLLRDRLADFGAAYGDLPAHDGLWQAAEETRCDLSARLAIVPLVLEARGLDVTPSMIERAETRGDEADAAVFRRIYEDEKKHVYFGAKWFKFLCDREGRPFEPTFHALVRKHFRGALKPPFNDRARSEAGLTPGFYRPLETIRT
ncbi:ferritin-like domain-containing protein [Amorphus coralli]|uniref:ferritin-like domain-containing protein n=1 Tax=Amorphus coralli TaxID=340680 RepID=UPI00036F0288|nr:ferritin-like domain-containing protein [Amorphus coralli]